MNVVREPAIERLDPRKFQDPARTAAGERRAQVALSALETLWINTGTLCNITCANCYIDSSPRNDRLAYITAAEVAGYLDEIAHLQLPTAEIAFTGGEPFMNPDLPAMLDDALGRGHRVLVLTNAMRPMMRRAKALAALRERHGDRIVLRVSLDHYTSTGHDSLRGPRTWAPALAGLRWLAENGFRVHVAGRTCWPESTAELRAGYARLFASEGISIDAQDDVALVLFPEMDETLDVPEITERCWNLLQVDPASLMCARSRMVIKRKGATAPTVVPCTLLPDDARFEMGRHLADAAGAVSLNHPHCARFCVLGGASCSRTGTRAA
ncbi:MAG: radical SAM protein [Alphaproteobacteria bacterium]